MIEQNMPIEAVIMPAFEVTFILKVVFKLKYNILTIRIIVNEQSRTITEVDIWSDKA